MRNFIKKLKEICYEHTRYSKLLDRISELESKCVELEKKCNELTEKDCGLDYRIDDVYHENFLTRKEILQYYGKYLKKEGYSELIKDWYFNETGERLNLENPVTYNEKIQWLKLYGIDEHMTNLSDKYKVRKWVQNTIGEEYLVPLLGVWDTFDDINFDVLPDRFVLKANHGSGMNVIVEDKKLLDIGEARKKFNYWLNIDYAFFSGLELQYSNIERKIIAEEYLENSKGNLNDWKVFCFNGEPKYIMFLTDRNNGLKMAFYDLEWKKQPFVYSYPMYEGEVKKPNQFDKMIELSRKLCKGFCHVRVDWYLFDDGSIKFGEMTFTSMSGICKWNPPEYNKILGDMIEFPEKWDNLNNNTY